MKLSVVVLTLCIAHSAYSFGFLDNIIKAPGNIINGATGLVRGAADGVVKGAADVVGGAAGLVDGVAGGVVNGATDLVEGVAGGVAKGATGLVDGAAGVVDGVAGGLVNGAAGVVDGAAGLVDGVAGGVVKGASDLVNGVFQPPSHLLPANPCARDVTEEYRKAMNNFHHKLYTHIAARCDNHFVFSPYTIWLSLSALAEGAGPRVQSEIFTSLNIPQESCIRSKFYNIALNVEKPGRDVSLQRQRSLLLDESLKVNPSWGRLMRSTGHLSYAYAPIKRNPQVTSQRVRSMILNRSKVVLRGNSVLLDSLDYEGLWTTAFPETQIQIQPFFNEVGQKIGTVEMMHMKKKVRLAHVPFLGSKVVELPVGENGRYTMLIAVGTGNSILKNAIDIFMGSIMEIFSLLQISLVPVEIAIPRFEVTSEFDARGALEDIDIRSFWRDPAATRFVSSPPAIPSGLIQRVSIKVDSQGVYPPPAVGKNLISGLVNLASNTASDVAAAVGHEFVADRPFMFALFDAETRTCLFAGAYSKPNNN